MVNKHFTEIKFCKNIEKQLFILFISCLWTTALLSVFQYIFKLNKNLRYMEPNALFLINLNTYFNISSNKMCSVLFPFTKNLETYPFLQNIGFKFPSSGCFPQKLWIWIKESPNLILSSLNYLIVNTFSIRIYRTKYIIQKKTTILT